MLTAHLQQLVTASVMQHKQSLIKNIFGSIVFVLKPQDILYFQECLWALLLCVVSKRRWGVHFLSKVPLNKAFGGETKLTFSIKYTSFVPECSLH